MNKAIFSGGLTFTTGITCGAVAYAARNDAIAVFFFTVFLSFAMGLIATAKEDN